MLNTPRERLRWIVFLSAAFASLFSGIFVYLAMTSGLSPLWLITIVLVIATIAGALLSSLVWQQFDTPLAEIALHASKVSADDWDGELTTNSFFVEVAVEQNRPMFVPNHERVAFGVTVEIKEQRL